MGVYLCCIFTCDMFISRMCVVCGVVVEYDVCDACVACQVMLCVIYE